MKKAAAGKKAGVVTAVNFLSDNLTNLLFRSSFFLYTKGVIFTEVLPLGRKNSRLKSGVFLLSMDFLRDNRVPVQCLSWRQKKQPLLVPMPALILSCSDMFLRLMSACTPSPG